MNSIPKISIKVEDALSLSEMKNLDYYAIENYHLPIELMMENAGFGLARIVANKARKEDRIWVGIGPGNNGGGGLVAARRLLGWGFEIFLDIPDDNLKELPQKQLERAKAFGAKVHAVGKPDIFIDAYFGFSQRLPLPRVYMNSISGINKSVCLKVSLDIPSGISKDPDIEYFKADIICTLAAPKKILFSNHLNAQIYIVDLGIPRKVYEELDLSFKIPFEESSIFEMIKED